jgi:hypothetical protein
MLIVSTQAEQLLAPLEDHCSIDSCSTSFIFWAALVRVQCHYIIILYNGNKVLMKDLHHSLLPNKFHTAIMKLASISFKIIKDRQNIK